MLLTSLGALFRLSMISLVVKKMFKLNNLDTDEEGIV